MKEIEYDKDSGKEKIELMTERERMPMRKRMAKKESEKDKEIE